MTDGRALTAWANALHGVLIHQDGWVVYINHAGTQLLRAANVNEVLGRHVSDLSPFLAALTPTDTLLPEPTRVEPRTPGGFAGSPGRWPTPKHSP